MDGYETSVEDGDQRDREVGELAQALLSERDLIKRQNGGVTPTQLQDLVGRATMGSGAYQAPELMLESLVFLAPSITRQELVSRVTLLALSLGSWYNVDAFEAAYEGFEARLEDAITVGRQAAGRLVDKTQREESR